MPTTAPSAAGTRDDFRDRIVLVTGAGSGIGREAARAFAVRGALVYCVGRHDQSLAETADLIGQEGGAARVARADVSNESEVAVLLARIERESGRLDVAFNNAGITGGAHRVEEYPSDDFDTVLRINLRGVFLGMKYQLPLMRRGGEACEVAAAAVWLCSPEASYVVGQMLVVDGGMTIGDFKYL